MMYVMLLMVMLGSVSSYYSVCMGGICGGGEKMENLMFSSSSTSVMEVIVML